MFPAILSRHGILGINARNLLYVRPFNPKKAVALADDKVRTKAFLTARGIPAAKMYARIETRSQLRSFDFTQLPDACVLKPNFGFGGEGIIVLHGRDKRGNFLRGKEDIVVTSRELAEHIEDILDGKFSLGGRRDMAFFEQILVAHECFAPFRPVGLPDIRVIVFNLVPIMAMLRIPTAQSDGKANLHLGGIGIGIDIAKGTTTHAAQYHHMIDTLPYGGTPSGHVLPHWDDILLICSRIQQITNIGYLAVDITIDQQLGPAVLEVNARAGLNVQVANLAPLRKRLERIEGLSVTSPEKGVRMGQDLFGENVRHAQRPRKDTVGKPVLGLRETVTFTGAGTTLEEPCIIAPDAEHTCIAPDLLQALQEVDAAEATGNGSNTYRVKMTLVGRKMHTIVSIRDQWEGAERVIIGRRDLQDFLIDPSKKKQQQLATPSVRNDMRAADTFLAKADASILLLKHLKPVNLAGELGRLQRDHLYNPVFIYPKSELDLEELRNRLSEPISNDAPIALLLEKKRKELLLRLDMLQARGDAQRFTETSIALFGKPNQVLLRDAKQALAQDPGGERPPESVLTSEQAAERFSAALEQYGLHNWKVSLRKRLVTDATVGGRHFYVREGATFAASHVDALIKHEIETHILCAENGGHQPFSLLRRGCAGYLDTQEGLAIFNQNRVYTPQHDKYYNAPRNVLGCAFALEHSLADTRAYLQEVLGYDEHKALTQVVAMKRGLGDTREPGAFTKSLVYFRGFLAITAFVEQGGDLRRLYVGKVALGDLSIVEDIVGLQLPLLLPTFLQEE